MKDILWKIRRIVTEFQRLDGACGDAVVRYLRSEWPQMVEMASETPQFLCIAGCPGAGKTEFIRRRRISERCAVMDPDTYRKYMPGYHDLPAADIVSRTKAFSDVLSLLVVWEAIYAGCSLCVSSTFTNTPFWNELLGEMRPCLTERNYHTKLIVLDQPKSELLRAICIRARSSDANEPRARLADIPFFEAKYSRFYEAVQSLIQLHFFESVSLLERACMEEEYSAADEASPLCQFLKGGCDCDLF